MSYRLIDANALNGVISNDDYEKVLNAPCIFADLPNGLDGEHYNLQEPCADAVSREAVMRLIENKPYDWSNLTERHNMLMEIRKLPSVTQKSNIKALGEELRKVRGGIKNDKVLCGYNMAVAICNKHLCVVESEEQTECEYCDYAEIVDWEQNKMTGKAIPIYWCERYRKSCSDIQECEYIREEQTE